jgi:photosystem II stability/assembly factor-like uncharacterized protein
MIPYRNLRTLLLLFLIGCIQLQAQWTVLNIPAAGRYDDICFVSDSVGWVAAGNTSRIWKTTDAGNSWLPQLIVTGDYMRSVGFANANLGFCGSLAGKFYRTIDGGGSWNNISNDIQPPPAGICGISTPDSIHIYACGKWKGPAFLLKSIDSGVQWTSIDLSSFASGLNEVMFLNRDTGFVAGKSAIAEEGGIILYTENGGSNWRVVHKTMFPGDYVWKIQSPDSLHFFASIEGLPSSGNVRMLKSSDRGINWETRIVSPTYSLSQVVGFIDTLHGWTGGKNRLFETIDGGETWTTVAVGVNYNRFRRVNDRMAFLSGDKIYRFNSDYPTTIEPVQQQSEEPHHLKVYPVPFRDFLNIEIELKSNTDVVLWLIDPQGKIVNRLLEADHKSGSYQFKITEDTLPGPHFFVVLKTNSGIQYREVIR